MDTTVEIPEGLPKHLAEYKRSVMQSLSIAVYIPVETLIEFYEKGIKPEQFAQAIETWPEFKPLHFISSGKAFIIENDVVEMLKLEQVPIVNLHGKYRQKAMLIAKGRTQITKAEFHEIYNKVFNLD